MSNIENINNVRKRCIRIITFSDFQAHTNQLFIDFKLLKVEEIITTNQLKLIYEFRNNILPYNLHDLFKLNKNLYKYETSSTSDDHLFFPKINTTTYGSKSIKYQGPSIWNKMMKQNVAINKSKPIKGFKSTLHKHYLASHSNIS